MGKSARPPLHYPLDAHKNSPFISIAIQKLNKLPFLKLYYFIATFTLLPLRLCIFIAAVIPLAFCAILATVGLKDKNPSHPQIVGWRKVLKNISWMLYRVVLFSYGVYSIKSKGKRTSTKNAPIFVVAPHTSIFFDMAPIYLNGGHPVASAHLLKVPVVGMLARLLDPVFLDRYDANSRKLAMNVVKERAKHAYLYRWKQVLFFPEGLCSNGDAFASFKAGAFVPGLPIQPITLKIKRHYQLNLTSWTHTGGQDMLCNYFQFCKPMQEIEVHYLDPYYPSEEEQNDPELFAYNVQRKMADYRKIPANDYSLHDANCVCRAVCRNRFKHEVGMIGIEGLAWRHGSRTAYIKTTVFDAFIRIANYMYKRVELKKDLVIGDGSLDPSLTVKDISCFYGFKGSKYIHELMKTHQREFNKEEVLDWETRSLEKNFGSHVEMTSRQFCEIFTNVACGLQAAPTLVNKGVDNDLLDKVAKILEKKINLVHDDVGDDYDLFDEGQALEVDSMVARAIGEAFTAYIGQDILARNRVAIIFDTFCLKTDSSDDGDHWATDYVAISKKLQRVILHVPFYYALIKEKES